MGLATQLGSAGVDRSPSPELLEVSGPLNTGFLLYQSMHACTGQARHSKMTPRPGNQSARPSHLTDGKLSPLAGAHSRRLPRVCSRSLLLQTQRAANSHFLFSSPLALSLFIFGGWRMHWPGLSSVLCHLSRPSTPTPPPACWLPSPTTGPPGWTGSDGSLQLLVKRSWAPPAAGGAATTGKDAMVTLTLRAPVRFWRNSVFPSLLSSPACVWPAHRIPTLPLPSLHATCSSHPCFHSCNPQ